MDVKITTGIGRQGFLAVSLLPLHNREVRELILLKISSELIAKPICKNTLYTTIYEVTDQKKNKELKQTMSNLREQDKNIMPPPPSTLAKPNPKLLSLALSITLSNKNRTRLKEVTVVYKASHTQKKKPSTTQSPPPTYYHLLRSPCSANKERKAQSVAGFFLDR